MVFENFRVRSKPKAIAVAVASIFVLVGGHTQGQTVYKCTNAAGAIVFSDKLCAGAVSVEGLRTSAESDLLQRKTEHDLTVSRDKALANQMEANRIANEQAGRSAQDQQTQVNRTLADKVEQERVQKNATVISSPGVSESAPIRTLP